MTLCLLDWLGDFSIAIEVFGIRFFRASMETYNPSVGLIPLGTGGTYPRAWTISLKVPNGLFIRGIKLVSGLTDGFLTWNLLGAISRVPLAYSIQISRWLRYGMIGTGTSLNHPLNSPVYLNWHLKLLHSEQQDSNDHLILGLNGNGHFSSKSAYSLILNFATGPRNQLKGNYLWLWKLNCLPKI